MKMKNSSNEINYYMPPQIKSMFSRGKENVLSKDWDRVYLIDGAEGTGKSLLGLQIGYFLDPTLNIDRVTFSAKEFGKALDKAKKGECVIFDEAFNGLSSSGATSKMNRFIVKKLMEVRQKNLFIIIILPTFFLLQKYAALFRSQCLFHVYSLKNGDRGYYKVYNRLNKKLLYLKGRALYNYSYPYIKKSWRFYGKYPIDEQAYRNKKAKAFEVAEEEEKYDVWAPRFCSLVELLKKDFNMNYIDIIKYLEKEKRSVERTQLSKLLKRFRRSDKDEEDEDPLLAKIT